MHWCYAYEMKFHLQIFSVILKLGPGANAPIAPWVIRYCMRPFIRNQAYLQIKSTKFHMFPRLKEKGFIEWCIQAHEKYIYIYIYISEINAPILSGDPVFQNLRPISVKPWKFADFPNPSLLTMLQLILISLFRLSSGF